MKLRYIQDPGHGWLEVPQGLLQVLGIEDKITSYSYINNSYVYLEEDLDMQTFILALKASSNIQLELVDVYQEHTAVRGYDAYQACLFA
jgi:hypothetical protein